MALPEIQAVGLGSASTGALTPALPGGSFGAGDLLVGWFESAGATAETEANTALELAGWTVVGSEKKGNTRLTIAWKKATGTADRRTTNDTGDHQLGRLTAIKKGTYNEEEPIHKSAFSTQASTKSVKCPSITTTLAECLILYGATGHLPDATAENTQFGTPVNSGLGSLTERMDNTTAEGDGGALMCGSGTKAAAGVVEETAVPATTEAERVCATIAIAPYSDPGSPKPISTSKTEATATSQEITRPTGEAGDIILVSVWSQKNKPVSVAGGTAIGAPKFLSTNVLCSSFWVPWSFNEKVKVTWEGSESQTTVVEMVNYRNCDPTNPVDVQSGWEEKALSEEPTCPSVATTGPNRRVIALTINANGNEPNDLPAGMTMRISYLPGIADGHQALAGESGVKKFHLTVARVTGVQTIALKKTEAAIADLGMVV